VFWAIRPEVFSVSSTERTNPKTGIRLFMCSTPEILNWRRTTVVPLRNMFGS
jgi:hypothetical protein